MNIDPYQVLHARPPLQIEAPKLISAVAFLVRQDNDDLKDYLSTTNITSFIESSQNQETEHVAKRISLREIDVIVRSCYDLYNNKLVIKAGQSLYDFFTNQKIIKDNAGTCVIQKHTSFFTIFFIKDDRSDLGKFNWTAIPEGFFHHVENAAFKTNIRVEKADPNEKDYGYKLSETFNCGVSSQYAINNIYTELFCSSVSDGGAVVFTPFRCFDDEFNRILIRDISLKPARLGRLVRRLAEMDMYVTLGGQNFYSAQEQLKCFKRYEYILKLILENAGKEKPNKEREIYVALTDVSKLVSGLISKTRYDFQATIAYSQLVWQEIFELREQRVEGWTRIGYFLEKTFRPCVRTCESALNYQIAVSQGIEQAASLLGAGLSLQLEEQAVKRAEENKEILEELRTLSETSVKDLNEQQERDRKLRSFRFTLELLAIFPLTYYLSHFIHEVSKGDWIWWMSFFVVTIGFLILLLARQERKILEWVWARLSGKI